MTYLMDSGPITTSCRGGGVSLIGTCHVDINNFKV